MRLAIVGSVSFRDQELFLKARTIVTGTIMSCKPDVIISGGADGVDSLAEATADIMGIPTVIHYPKNNRWAPDGFKDRNLLIAQDCTHLLCIRDKTSKTYGSGWTSDRAKEMGKVVWRYDI